MLAELKTPLSEIFEPICKLKIYRRSSQVLQKLLKNAAWYYGTYIE